MKEEGEMVVAIAKAVGLSGLINLNELNLESTKVTDAGLTHLSGLINLRDLDLGGTNVTDEGIKKLKQALPGCSIHR